MSDYLIKKETLTDIADEIRTLSGTTSPMSVATMTSTLNTENTNFENNLTEQNDLISQISTLVATKASPQGGTDTSDATATASDILSGKTAYVDGEKITGNIATKTSSNLTTSGATVTVPAGYYASQASKTISSGSAKTPSTTVTKNPTISVNSSGLITASVSGTQSITPTVTAGYVSSGTAGTITVSGSTTKQLTAKAATTYTPSTSNQTIASGTYLTGTQTIQGDANLVADNIKNGVSIFGVTGRYEGSGGGSAGTCTVRITQDGPTLDSPTFYYTDANMNYQTVTTNEGSIVVAANTIIAMTGWASMNYVSGSCSQIFYKTQHAAYLCTGDCIFTISA